jgi:hypothetical protein
MPSPAPPSRSAGDGGGCRALTRILCIFFPVLILIVVALLPPKQRPEPPEVMS